MGISVQESAAHVGLWVIVSGESAALRPMAPAALLLNQEFSGCPHPVGQGLDGC